MSDVLLTKKKNRNKRGESIRSNRRRKEELRIKEGFSEEYHKEMEQRRKDSEAKKKKKTPPKDTKKKQPPKDTKKKPPETKKPPTENKDKVKIPKEGDTTKKTPPKDTKPKTPPKDTKKKDPKDTKPKTPPKDTKKKDPKKDNGRLTENKASDFLDGVKNPSKGEQAKKKPKKRLSAREKMRKKNEARFGKGHVDRLRKKNEDFKKMKRKQMSKEEFIEKYPKSITAQKHHGLRR